MNTLLNDLKTEWQKVDEYKNVEAEYWVPGQPQEKTCSHGCVLEIYEGTPEKWGLIPNRDVRRQTRICRKHGFARIYVITGLKAKAAKWDPNNS